MPDRPNIGTAVTGEHYHADCAETAEWLRSQRADLRARACALRRAGQAELAKILKVIADPEIRRVLITVPLPDLAKASARFRDRLPPEILTRLKGVPWGYKETDLTALGALSLHPERVIDFQESPILSRRVGRRAKCAEWLATVPGQDVFYGVATYPDPVPHFGGLREALSKHLASIRKASAAVQKAGFYLLFRSTELTISHTHVHIHSNILWIGPELTFPVSTIEKNINARYHDSGRAYDMPKLARYVTKTPVTASRGVADHFKLLHNPDIIGWLHRHLSGRRLIECGRRQYPSKEEITADPFDAAPNERFTAAGIDSVSEGAADSGGSVPTSRQGATGGLIASGSTTVTAPDTPSQGDKQSPLLAIENEIVTIRPAALHSSGRTEPIIIVRGYTRNPKTASGRAGLQEIMAIHRDEIANSSSATAAATYLDNRTALINNKTSHGTEVRWEIQHVYDVEQAEWKFGPVEIDDDDDDAEEDLWFDHVDLSILDQPVFDPGKPPANPNLLPGWERSVERRRKFHESEVAHARLAARAKWDYATGAY